VQPAKDRLEHETRLSRFQVLPCHSQISPLLHSELGQVLGSHLSWVIDPRNWRCQGEASSIAPGSEGQLSTLARRTVKNFSSVLTLASQIDNNDMLFLCNSLQDLHRYAHAMTSKLPRQAPQDHALPSDIVGGTRFHPGFPLTVLAKATQVHRLVHAAPTSRLTLQASGNNKGWQVALHGNKKQETQQTIVTCHPGVDSGSHSHRNPKTLTRGD